MESKLFSCPNNWLMNLFGSKSITSCNINRHDSQWCHRSLEISPFHLNKIFVLFFVIIDLIFSKTKNWIDLEPKNLDFPTFLHVSLLLDLWFVHYKATLQSRISQFCLVLFSHSKLIFIQTKQQIWLELRLKQKFLYNDDR